jgi:hypothetical protein
MSNRGSAQWVICGLLNEIKADGSREWSWVNEQPVTDDEVQSAQEAIDVLTEDFEQPQLNLVLTNFKMYMGYWGRIPEAWESTLREAPNPVTRLQAGLAVRLFNWLQSIRAYIDHTERRLKRRFGKDSDEVRAYKEIRSNEYDDCFAYRFFYKLRNYGHVDFPALGLNVKDRKPIGMPPAKISATVVLRRDVLLKNYEEWGAKVSRDLAQMPEEFDLMAPMVDMMESLDRIKAVVTLIEEELLRAALSTLDALRDRLEETDGHPTLLLRIQHEDGSPKGVKMISIPPFELPEISNRTTDI